MLSSSTTVGIDGEYTNSPEVVLKYSQQTSASRYAYASQRVDYQDIPPEVKEHYGPQIYILESGGVINSGTRQAPKLVQDANALPFLIFVTGLEPVTLSQDSYTLSQTVSVFTTFPTPTDTNKSHLFEATKTVGSDNIARRVIPMGEVLPYDGYLAQWEKSTSSAAANQSITGPAAALVQSPVPPYIANPINPDQVVPLPPATPVNFTPADKEVVQLYIDYQPHVDPDVFGVCFYIYIKQMERQTCTLWNFRREYLTYVGHRIFDWTQNPKQPLVYGPQINQQ